MYSAYTPIDFLNEAWAFQIVHGRELLEEEWKNNAPEDDKATRKTRKKINTLQDDTYKFPSEKIPYSPRGSLQWHDNDDGEVENESVVSHGKGISLITAAEIKNFLENEFKTLTAEVSMHSSVMFHIDSRFICSTNSTSFSSSSSSGHPEPCGAFSQFKELLRLSRSFAE